MRYCLLAITWVILLAANIYLWIQDATNPNIWIWIILAALSVIPLADSLKIGSWFDFRKKGAVKEKEINELQERVMNIGNINVQLQSQEAAQAFAESMFSKPVPNELQTAGELTEEHKELITFLSSADKALDMLKPLVEVLYVTVFGKLEKQVLGSEEWDKLASKVRGLSLLSMIAELKVNAHKVFDFKDGEKKFKELFEPVESLIRIREDIDKTDAKPPSRKEAINLVGKVFNASGFLAGMFTAGMSALVMIVCKRS
ncbi:MAG: hypothetical protein WC369_07025 [Dehalococcoidales bacterium]|jgi:hypothetical protein